MRIYCLTSLKLIPKLEGIQRVLSDEIEDEYSINGLNPKNQEKYKAYALTEINIGYDFIPEHPLASYRKKQIKLYSLTIYSENTNAIRVAMLRGNVKLDKIKENVYDLTVGLPQSAHNHLKDYDIVLRIRCIKNTNIKGLLSKNEEMEYIKFAEKINAHPEGREMAFEYETFSLPNESNDSALRTKLSDLNTLIHLLCDPETGSVENVPSGKRYNQRSKCLLLMQKCWIHINNGKTRKKEVKNEAENFRDCRSINLKSVKLSGIKHFESEILEDIMLTDINIAEDIKSLKNFKAPRLNQIILRICDIQILADAVTDHLPVSLELILLEKCNITSIPTTISRLVNLIELDVVENKGLKENGVPWEHLPLSLRWLELDDNGITEIPPSINRLKNLSFFTVISDNLRSVAWNDISDEIEFLTIESKMELEPAKLFDKKKLDWITISCLNLKAEINFSSLNYLHLTGCNLRTFDCNVNWENLTELSLGDNNLENISWEMLPVTLEKLLLYKNKFQKIRNIGHLKNLRELDLSYNIIDFISTEINKLENLGTLHLSNNKLFELPEDFGNLHQLWVLNLSNNAFKYDENSPDDLNNKLWKRLPPNITVLKLNSNNLFRIPCCLKILELEDLDVTNCNLHHICPNLYIQARQQKKIFWHTHLSVNICNNPKLQCLPFVPRIIYQPPPATEEKRDDTLWFGKLEIATDNEKLRNTAKFQTQNLKPVYDLKPSKLTVFCDCCGNCGKITKNKPLIKQNMVMDFAIVFTNAEEIYPFGNPNYGPGKWKSEIHTKLCSVCQIKFIEKTEKAYEKFTHENDEIIEIIEKRQKLPLENLSFEIPLQALQIQKLQYLKLKNYDAVDCFLIAAVNAIDAMDELKISIFKNLNNNETQKELIKIFKQKIKSVRSLRDTLPTFAKNEQEDAGSALCKLIESLDETSKSLVMYVYDTVERCLCETSTFQHVPNCITVHLTVGQDPNQSITFNSMLANWTRFSSNPCLICGSEKIIDRNVQLGDLQQYLIVELHTMTNNPNGTLVPCSIPFTNFNANSQLIFGALWELKCAIQYIGNGKTGHYITWKKNKTGWTVIDEDGGKHENQLLQNLKNYKVLIFKKLVVQLLANNDETTEASSNNSIPVSVIEQNQDEDYIPNHCFLQNNIGADSTVQQNTLPPIGNLLIKRRLK